MKEYEYERALHAAEARVAEERIALRRAAADWRRGRRDAAVSPGGLLGATAVGFLLGGLMQRRRARPAVGAAAVGAAAGGGVFTVLAGLAMSLLRARYGDPWSAASRLLLRRLPPRQRARPPPRTPPTLATSTSQREASAARSMGP